MQFAPVLEIFRHLTKAQCEILWLVAQSCRKRSLRRALWRWNKSSRRRIILWISHHTLDSRLCQSLNQRWLRSDHALQHLKNVRSSLLLKFTKGERTRSWMLRRKSWLMQNWWSLMPKWSIFSSWSSSVTSKRLSTWRKWWAWRLKSLVLRHYNQERRSEALRYHFKYQIHAGIKWSIASFVQRLKGALSSRNNCLIPLLFKNCTPMHLKIVLPHSPQAAPLHKSAPCARVR